MQIFADSGTLRVHGVNRLGVYIMVIWTFVYEKIHPLITDEVTMAFYQNGNFLTQEQRPEYDVTHHPGEIASVSGVFRCDGCHASVVSTKGNHLPPQNHHQHTASQGAVRWRLVVRTTHIQ
jgi:hypothetical protein